MTDHSANSDPPDSSHLPNQEAVEVSDNPDTPDPAAASTGETLDSGRAASALTRPPHMQDVTAISQRSPLHDASAVVAGPLRLSDIGRVLSGQELGHFRLEEFVGGGGMGAVFRATDTQLKRTVAVKVLTHRYGHDDDTVRRFRVEAQSAARLNHENIARVYFVGEDKGWNFIVFEFIEGENIRDLVGRVGPLPVEQAVHSIAQIAEALQHAAERDVVHRDIKPSNVLLTPEGRAKLVDMGLARLRQVESSDDDLTVSGVTLGTFDYISPEQGRDPRNADVRSDLYSLGCTFYFMLTGQPPFPHGTVLQKLLSHTSDAPPDPRALRVGLPEDLAAVVIRLLAKLPEQRYQQPSQLIDDLALAAERNELPITFTTSSRPAASVRQTTWLHRHLPWFAPSLLFLTVVAGWDWLSPFSNSTPVALPEFRMPVEPAAPDDSPSPPDRDPAFSASSPTELPGSRKPLSAARSTERTDFESKTTPREPTGPADSPAETDAVDLAASTPPTGPPPPTAEESAGAPTASPSWIVADPQSPLPPDVEQGQVQVVTSLDEALRQAADIETPAAIEIRTSEPQMLKPVLLERSDTRIFAAEGYSPVLRFEAARVAPDGPLFTANGGVVRFEGIQFEFDLRGADVQTVSMFRVGQAELFALSDCWIKVVADPQPPSGSEGPAVLEVAMPNREAPAFLGDEPTEALPLEVHFHNCVICGAATVMRLPLARPLRFAWTNGLLVTSQPAFHVGGTIDAARNDEFVKVDLDHLTAVLPSGLGLFTTRPDLPHLYAIDVNATRSIFITPADAPLFESRGDAALPEELDSHLLFSGERNFYEGTEVFWLKGLTSGSTTTDEPPIRLLFEEWQRRWETTERRLQRNKVQWQSTVDESVPLHQRTPQDYLLSDAPNNPARRAGGGVDRSDAGFRLEELPRSPLLPQP